MTKNPVYRNNPVLGNEVADLMETVEFLAIPWSEYFDGKLTIEDILKA